jgi:hypothetical protein
MLKSVKLSQVGAGVNHSRRGWFASVTDLVAMLVAMVRGWNPTFGTVPVVEMGDGETLPTDLPIGISEKSVVFPHGDQKVTVAMSNKFQATEPKYRQLACFRRLAALRMLESVGFGPFTIPVNVLKVSQAEELILNLEENYGRNTASREADPVSTLIAMRELLTLGGSEADCQRALGGNRGLAQKVWSTLKVDVDHPGFVEAITPENWSKVKAGNNRLLLRGEADYEEELARIQDGKSADRAMSLKKLGEIAHNNKCLIVENLVKAALLNDAFQVREIILKIKAYATPAVETPAEPKTEPESK